MTHTKLIGTPNTLWLLGTVGRRLRKCARGEGKLRARRSQADSCSVGILYCPISDPGLTGSVGDRGGCRIDGMGGRPEKANRKTATRGTCTCSHTSVSSCYISRIPGNHMNRDRHLGATGIGHRGSRRLAMVERVQKYGKGTNRINSSRRARLYGETENGENGGEVASRGGGGVTIRKRLYMYQPQPSEINRHLPWSAVVRVPGERAVQNRTKNISNQRHTRLHTAFAECLN